MQLQPSAQIQRLVKESVGEKLTDEDAEKKNRGDRRQRCTVKETAGVVHHAQERVQNRTAERVVDVQVPQIQSQEKNVEVIQLVPHVRMSDRIVEQIVELYRVRNE